MYLFGEGLFIRLAQERSGRPKRDLQPRMVEARSVGHHSRIQSIIGLTPEGVVYGQCAKRLHREKRYPIAGWNELKGLPWDQNSNARDLPTEASDPDRIVVIQQPQQQQQQQQ